MPHSTCLLVIGSAARAPWNLAGEPRPRHSLTSPGATAKNTWLSLKFWTLCPRRLNEGLGISSDTIGGQMAPSTALREEPGSGSPARGRPRMTHEISPSRSKTCVTRMAKWRRVLCTQHQKAQCHWTNRKTLDTARIVALDCVVEYGRSALGASPVSLGRWSMLRGTQEA